MEFNNLNRTHSLVKQKSIGQSGVDNGTGCAGCGGGSQAQFHSSGGKKEMGKKEGGKQRVIETNGDKS